MAVSRALVTTHHALTSDFAGTPPVPPGSSLPEVVPDMPRCCAPLLSGSGAHGISLARANDQLGPAAASNGQRARTRALRRPRQHGCRDQRAVSHSCTRWFESRGAIQRSPHECSETGSRGRSALLDAASRCRTRAVRCSVECSPIPHCAGLPRTASRSARRDISVLMRSHRSPCSLSEPQVGFRPAEARERSHCAPFPEATSNWASRRARSKSATHAGPRARL